MYAQESKVWLCRVRHSPCPLKELEVEADSPVEASEQFLQANLEAARARKQSGPELVRLIEGWVAQGGLAQVEVSLTSGLPEVEPPSGFAEVRVAGDLAAVSDPSPGQQPAAGVQTQAVSGRPPRRRRQTQATVAEPAPPPDEVINVTV